MTNDDLADLIRTRTDGVADHIERQLSVVQAGIESELGTLEGDLQDLRDEVALLLPRTG